MGPYALPFIEPALEDEGYDAPPVGPDGAALAAAQYFNNRKLSIFGGSNEIQRNIISQDDPGAVSHELRTHRRPPHAGRLARPLSARAVHRSKRANASPRHPKAGAASTGHASPNWARSACCSAKPTAATAAAASTSRSSSSSWAAGSCSNPSSARCWSAAPSPRPAATRSAMRWARSSPAAASPRWRTRSPTRSTTRRGSARARSAAATAGCSTAPRRWWRRPKRPICCWSTRAPRARPTPKPASRCSSCRPRRPASRCAATR